MTRDDIAEVVAIYALPLDAPRGDEWDAIVGRAPSLRCAHCPAPATDYLLSRLCGPYCAAHADMVDDAEGVLCGVRQGALRWDVREAHVVAVRLLTDAAVYRDRRAELGLPPDPRFYGADWTLFGEAPC